MAKLTKAKIKNFLKTSPLPNCSSGAVLLLRVVVGIAFAHHGWGKMQSPLSWMGPESQVPGFLQFLAAFSEFGGGFALILGLLTRLGALGLICTMVVASSMHAIDRGDPFVSSGGPAYELPLVYLCINILLLMIGPGKFSLDAKVFGERK